MESEELLEYLREKTIEKRHWTKAGIYTQVIVDDIIPAIEKLITLEREDAERESLWEALESVGNMKLFGGSGE